MKKKILIISIFLLAISMLFILTNTARAADVTITNVEPLTGGSIQNNGNEYTITLTKTDINNLEWHSKSDPTGQEGVDRVANGWDVGFKLTFSEAIQKGDLKTEYTDNEGKVHTNLEGTPDTNPAEYSVWVSLNENKLAGQTETFRLAKFVFTIGNDTKTVIINIDPRDVVLKEPDDGRMIKVIVDGYEFTMEKGKNLTADETKGGLTVDEAKKLKELMTPEEGYKFVGLFDIETEKEVTLNQAILADMELEVKFEELPKVTKPTEKDNTPKTGVTDVALISSVMAMVSAAGIIAVKKYNK